MTSSTTIKGILPPHQEESGIVTERELLLTERWVAAVQPGGAAGASSDAWLDGWLGTGQPFSFRYGGQDSRTVIGKWELQEQEHEHNGSGEFQRFVWSDVHTGLRVSWELKSFVDYPAAEWLVTFENTGTVDTPIIEDIQPLDLCLNHSTEGRAYTIHGAQGGRSQPDDLMPFSRQVPFLGSPRNDVIELGGDGTSSNVHLPFFGVETPENRGVVVGIGWSGSWSARAEASGNQLRVASGLRETHLVLRPGERIRTPRILLVFWEGKRLHGHNVLRQLLYRHYIPRLRGEFQEPLVAANAAFAHDGKGLFFLHQASEEKMLSAVQSAIDVGAELFIIDAGWFEGAPWHEALGNWRISRSKYPKGFRPIAEPLAKAGVELGVWFAPEVVSERVSPPDGHSEWLSPGGRPHHRRLRLEMAEPRQWFLEQVDDIIENEGMTCYRQDIDPGEYVDLSEDRTGVTESLHIDGLYAVWDTLVQRHPDLIMEGCCGGGRRIDLETVSRFRWIQKSDRWFDSESDQCSLYGANLFLPGGYIINYTEATDDYGVWSSFAGVLSVAWNPNDEGFPLALARRQVERYKRTRHLLSGDFYPLTPCSPDAEWLGYQFHRVDLDEGMALLFRRLDQEQAVYPVDGTFKLRLRGLEPQRRYRVRLEGAGGEQTLTGEALAKGIEVTIEKAPGAEMALYKPVT